MLPSVCVPAASPLVIPTWHAWQSWPDSFGTRRNTIVAMVCGPVPPCAV